MMNSVVNLFQHNAPTSVSNR